MEKGIQGAQTTSIIGSLSLSIYTYIYMCNFIYISRSQKEVWPLVPTISWGMQYYIYIYLFIYLFIYSSGKGTQWA